MAEYDESRRTNSNNHESTRITPTPIQAPRTPTPIYHETPRTPIATRLVAAIATATIAGRTPLRPEFRIIIRPDLLVSAAGQPHCAVQLDDVDVVVDVGQVCVVRYF